MLALVADHEVTLGYWVVVEADIFPSPFCRHPCDFVRLRCPARSRTPSEKLEALIYVQIHHNFIGVNTRRSFAIRGVQQNVQKPLRLMPSGGRTSWPTETRTPSYMDFRALPTTVCHPLASFNMLLCLLFLHICGVTPVVPTPSAPRCRPTGRHAQPAYMRPGQ